LIWWTSNGRWVWVNSCPLSSCVVTPCKEEVEQDVWTVHGLNNHSVMAATWALHPLHLHPFHLRPHPFHLLPGYGAWNGGTCAHRSDRCIKNKNASRGISQAEHWGGGSVGHIRCVLVVEASIFHPSLRHTHTTVSWRLSAEAARAEKAQKYFLKCSFVQRK